jgi:hypothetical protein
MLKWLLTLALAVLVLGVCAPRLSRHLHLGRLPCDLACRYKGREYRFPFTSIVLLSLLLTLLTRLF